MNFVGGLSLFVNIFINLFAWIWRRVKKHFGFLPSVPQMPIPGFILGAIASVIITANAGLLFAYALRGENNLEHWAIAMAQCTPFEKTIKDRKVVIRIDDIQSFAWADIQKRMINDAISREIPLSLATIPLNLRQDIDMYIFLRKARCNVEFALHGWDNIEVGPKAGEFARLNYSQASEKLRKGIRVVNDLSGERVVTFVPPNNTISEESRRAAADLGIKIISAEGEGKFDYDSSIIDYDTNEFLGAKPVIDGCERGLKKDGLCVIMLHPQDYATESGIDDKKYAEYLKILNHFMRANVSFVRFSDLSI